MLVLLALSNAACRGGAAALDAAAGQGDAALVDLDPGLAPDAAPDLVSDGGEGLDALVEALDAAPPDAGVQLSDAQAIADGSPPLTDDLAITDSAPPLTDLGAMADLLVVEVCPEAAALQDAIEGERERLGITGVIGRFSMPGCHWTGASGVVDRATGLAVVPTDRYRVGSITKTLTAAVILLLMEEGKLDLDDPLSTFVTFPGGDGILIRHLLSHTSGIYDFLASPTVSADQGRPWSHDEVIAIAAAQPSAFTPGSKWAYSNTNYFLLGMVIEQVTGKAYHEEVRSRLLTPLGLDDTYLEGPESLPGGLLVRSYDHASGPYVDVTSRTHPSLGWSAGSYISTAADMEDWGRALLTGSVLLPATRALMLTPTALSGGGTGSTGLCIFVQNLGGTLGLLYSHHAWFGGFRTVIGYLPTSDAMTVAFSKDEGGPANPLMTSMWIAAGLL